MKSHKVASRSELFIPGVLVDIRTEEFILPLDKESALSVGEYIIAVNPSA